MNPVGLDAEHDLADHLAGRRATKTCWVRVDAQAPVAAGAGNEEDARDLGLEHVTKAARRALPERLLVREEPRIDRPHTDTGVVDQRVDAAEALARLGDAHRHGPLVADIQLDPTTAGPSSRAVASARSRLRLVTPTRAPAAASASAMARPRPLVAPVTTTRAPSSDSVTGDRGVMARSNP